jgi:hypothetical protein
VVNQNPVLTDAVSRAAGAVAKTAASPTNDMNPDYVAGASAELRANIAQAISPLIQHLTNNEPHFWLKRTFWSQVGSGLGAIASIGVPVVQYLQAHTIDSGTASVSMFGLAMCIWSNYSAWSARNSTTPLGTPKPPENPVKYRG